MLFVNSLTLNRKIDIFNINDSIQFFSSSINTLALCKLTLILSLVNFEHLIFFSYVTKIHWLMIWRITTWIALISCLIVHFFFFYVFWNLHDKCFLKSLEGIAIFSSQVSISYYTWFRIEKKKYLNARRKKIH